MAIDNHQSTQQHSSELSYSNVAGSSRLPSRSACWYSLLKLLKHRPWLVWSGVWAFLLTITTIAIFSLTYTSHVKQEEPQPTPVTAENRAEKSSQIGSPIPLWLLSAVAFTCAAGYLVISKSLNRSSQPSKLRKRFQRSCAGELIRPQQEPPTVSTPLEPLPPFAPAPAEIEPIEPVVTVLPPEESHPLDSDCESLAEMMDIRRQRSLSSILQDFPR